MGIGSDVALPLAHQLMGMCVFTSLVLATCDVWQVGRTQPTSGVDPALAGVAAAGGH